MSQKGQLTTADYLPIEEFNRLVEGLHNDRLYLWELYCRLSFCTALRRSDVLSLCWRDVLGKSELTKSEHKTQKLRKIPFNQSVQLKIEELYLFMGSPPLAQYIFYNSKTKQVYHKDTINRKLKTFRVAYRLSIKRFSTHTFRKTFGRYVYESNNRSAESLILLNSIFRHSNIEITKIYIGLRQDEINRVFASISF